MIDFNPQQVLIIAQELLAAGWIQGKEKGWAESGNHQGVCIVGALRDAVGQILRPQVEEMCLAIPEYVALSEVKQQAFVTDMVAKYENPLINVFRARFAQHVPENTIEGWNDSDGRKKAEVLAAMKSTLEIVTKECVAEWDQQPEQTDERLDCEAAVPVLQG
jgi:hypothetical protein